MRSCSSLSARGGRRSPQVQGSLELLTWVVNERNSAIGGLDGSRVAFTIAYLAAIVYALLMMRLTALRKDRSDARVFLALPKDFNLGELFSKETYTDPGARLLPWLWISLLVMVVAGGFAVVTAMPK